MKVLDVKVNHDVAQSLSKGEASLMIFNLLRRLSTWFGGRAVHVAIVCYLGLSGYDVHKF